MQLFWNAAGSVECHVSGTTSGASAVLTNQQWHQVVGTYDGTNIRLYVDGALSQTAAKLGPITVNRPVGIGAEPGGGTLAFEGAIAEVSIYAATLSGARVSAHFAAADQLVPPVFSASGGLFGGAGSQTPYLGILNQILASVRKVY